MQAASKRRQESREEWISQGRRFPCFHLLPKCGFNLSPVKRGCSVAVAACPRLCVARGVFAVACKAAGRGVRGWSSAPRPCAARGASPPSPVKWGGGCAGVVLPSSSGIPAGRDNRICKRSALMIYRKGSDTGHICCHIP